MEMFYMNDIILPKGQTNWEGGILKFLLREFGRKFWLPRAVNSNLFETGFVIVVASIVVTVIIDCTICHCVVLKRPAWGKVQVIFEGMDGIFLMNDSRWFSKWVLHCLAPTFKKVIWFPADVSLLWAEMPLYALGKNPWHTFVLFCWI